MKIIGKECGHTLNETDMPKRGNPYCEECRDYVPPEIHSDSLWATSVLTAEEWDLTRLIAEKLLGQPRRFECTRYWHEKVKGHFCDSILVKSCDKCGEKYCGGVVEYEDTDCPKCKSNSCVQSLYGDLRQDFDPFSDLFDFNHVVDFAITEYKMKIDTHSYLSKQHEKPRHNTDVKYRKKVYSHTNCDSKEESVIKAILMAIGDIYGR